MRSGPWLATALAGGAVCLAAIGARLRWHEAVGDRVSELAGPAVGTSWSIRALLERLGRTGPATRWGRDDRLRRRYELAGAPASWDLVLGSRAALFGAGVLISCLLVPAAPSALGLVPALGLAGLRAPDLVLGLVATTEAGIGVAMAFRRSAEVLIGPLGEELRTAARQMDLGVPWGAAMDQMVERTEAPSLRRVARSLTRSRRLGAPVRSTLRSLAEETRAERRTHAEEMARRAPVKMLFPLVFLILPAFLLLTVGPVLLATIRSLRSA